MSVHQPGGTPPQKKPTWSEFCVRRRVMLDASVCAWLDKPPSWGPGEELRVPAETPAQQRRGTPRERVRTYVLFRFVPDREDL